MEQKVCVRAVRELRARIERDPKVEQEMIMFTNVKRLEGSKEPGKKGKRRGRAK